MSKEAIAHYEAALKEAFPRGATGEVFHHWNEARYLIATEALEKMAENARELGLDYDAKSDHRLMEQPEQEPVAFEKTVCPFCTSEWVTAEQHDRNVDRVERKPLTLDELWRVFTRSGLSQFHQRDGVVEYKYEKCIEEFGRAIEAAHGIKGEV